MLEYANTIAKSDEEGASARAAAWVQAAIKAVERAPAAEQTVSRSHSISPRPCGPCKQKPPTIIASTLSPLVPFAQELSLGGCAVHKLLSRRAELLLGAGDAAAASALYEEASDAAMEAGLAKLGMKYAEKAAICAHDGE